MFKGLKKLGRMYLKVAPVLICLYALVAAVPLASWFDNDMYNQTVSFRTFLLLLFLGTVLVAPVIVWAYNKRRFTDDNDSEGEP